MFKRFTSFEPASPSLGRFNGEAWGVTTDDMVWLFSVDGERFDAAAVDTDRDGEFTDGCDGFDEAADDSECNAEAFAAIGKIPRRQMGDVERFEWEDSMIMKEVVNDCMMEDEWKLWALETILWNAHHETRQ